MASLLFPLSAGVPAVPSVTLLNAAKPGVKMPFVGLGTGGYGSEIGGCGRYPEGWAEPHCGDAAFNATMQWLTVAGGRRVDNADSYGNMATMGRAIKAAEKSGVKRSDIFLVGKVGPSLPLGYNETKKQVSDSLAAYGTDYIDLMLVHWPTNTKPSSDPACSPGGDETRCRLNTWNALVEALDDSLVRAIGVSNFNVGQLKEIEEAKLPLPAVNQCPCVTRAYNLIYIPPRMHLPAINPCPGSFRTRALLLLLRLTLPNVPQCLRPAVLRARGAVSQVDHGLGCRYRYNPHLHTAQAELVAHCKAKGILFNSYSPLGIPDWHTYAGGKLLDEPAVARVGAKHAMSAAQVLLSWQFDQGIVFNPRSMSLAHQKENLDPAVFSGKLA